MKQDPKRRKSGGLLEGKGFYIVLLLCIAAIGVSGYYLFSGLTGRSGGFGSEPAAVVSGQAEIKKDGPQPQRPPVPPSTQPKTTETKPTETPDQPAADAKQPETPDPKAAASAAYVWPVQGSIERDFSLEVFAYDETMGDWRTHDGLDIQAQVGTPVRACAKGTVADIETDDMMGTMVVIDHGSGMESVYANLDPGVKVQKGQTVAAGDEIGAVGTSAIAESAAPNHLHFAMREYGFTIDPLNYLH